MIKYSAETIINENIEEIFDFIDGKEENLKKIDPKIVKNKLKSEKPGKIGTTYVQQYKEKSKVLEYIVTVSKYVDEPEHKEYAIKFNLLKRFEINAMYKFDKLSEKQTKAYYEIVGIPLKLSSKMMLKMVGKSYGQNVVKNQLKNLKANVEK